MQLRSFFYKYERCFTIIYLACLVIFLGVFSLWLFNDMGGYALEEYILRRYQNIWQERYEKAREMWVSGEIPGAETTYERFLADIPANRIRDRLAPLKVAAFRDLCCIYLQDGKQDMVWETFNRLVSLDPKNYLSNYYFLVSRYKSMGDLNEAVNSFKESRPVSFPRREGEHEER